HLCWLLHKKHRLFIWMHINKLFTKSVYLFIFQRCLQLFQVFCIRFCILHFSTSSPTDKKKDSIYYHVPGTFFYETVFSTKYREGCTNPSDLSMSCISPIFCSVIKNCQNT